MIKVNDRFYINADSNCYSLNEKTTIQDETSPNQGNEVFKNRGYYTSIEGCIEGILKIKTREFIGKEEVNTLQELKTEIKAQTEYLKSLNLEV